MSDIDGAPVYVICTISQENVAFWRFPLHALADN